MCHAVVGAKSLVLGFETHDAPRRLINVDLDPTATTCGRLDLPGRLALMGVFLDVDHAAAVRVGDDTSCCVLSTGPTPSAASGTPHAASLSDASWSGEAASDEEVVVAGASEVVEGVRQQGVGHASSPHGGNDTGQVIRVPRSRWHLSALTCGNVSQSPGLATIFERAKQARSTPILLPETDIKRLEAPATVGLGASDLGFCWWS